MNSRQKEVLEQSLQDEQAVLDALKKNYTEALADIKRNIRELQANPLTQSKAYQLEFQKNLEMQVSGIIDRLQGNNFTSVSEYLQTCYQNGFVGTMYSIQGSGIPLIIPINETQVLKAVQKTGDDFKLTNKLGVSTKELKNQVKSEIQRGFATQASYDVIARSISDYGQASMNRSMLIARTEGHRIQNQSSMDAMKAAKKKGADIVKQWDATLDGNTRQHHRELDGQIRELDEPFEVAGMKVECPGDFGIAAEDCNCRCCVLQRARWALGETELQTLKDRASYFGLDKSKDFESYREKYIQVTKDAVKTVPKFSPAKTIAEAEAFIKQYVDDSGFGALGVSYQGISVDVANELNKAISNFYETFDVQKFGGILAPAGNTKLGQKITGATAAYSPVRNSFLVNRKSMKDMKTAVKSFQAEKDALQLVLEHPERFDFNKFSRTLRETIERSKVSGRATVPESIEEAIYHELGHMMERKVYQSPLWDDVVADMPKYADKISGYAGSDKSEYVAESFASYLKGEKLCDPNLVRIFESLKR